MMDLQGRYNERSPAVKRLMREACELRASTEEYSARPLEDNLFEWHFTVQGPPGTEFEGGVYHGRIILPTEYPMKPPNIILLTPNGRFETNKKICLSISGHHPETWQPSWSIRTALLALIAFMPTPGSGTIGSLDYTPEERKTLARRSRNWECSTCGRIVDQLAHPLSNGQQLSVPVTDDAMKPPSPPPAQQPEEEQPQQQQHLVETAVALLNPSMGEYFKTAAIWLLVALISMLLFRRLFLL